MTDTAPDPTGAETARALRLIGLVLAAIGAVLLVEASIIAGRLPDGR